MTQNFIVGKTKAGQTYSNKNFGQNYEPDMVQLILRLWDGATHDVNVFAYITNFSVTCAVGEVVSASISFEGHGAPYEMDMFT